jgi:Protein of unknown function (DUF3788)
VALSSFDDKSRPPAAAEVETVLGEAGELWKGLVAHVVEKFAPTSEVWSFAGPKYGWSLRLRRRDRIVLYMTPQIGHFLVGVVLGERAVEAAQNADLPESVRALIDSAPRYAEGRGIRFTVTTPAELAAAKKLAAIKLAP